MQSSWKPQGEQHNFEGEGETGKKVGRSIYTYNTVDGSEIRRSPVDMVNIP